MDQNIRRKIICALDTGDLGEARETVAKLKDWVGAFKIGHALTLPYGLGVLEDLRTAGAERIFLDLKFHDIPNTVALGVREAAKCGVWMLTLHLSGGKAMIGAAVEEARAFGDVSRPLLMGVSVLTSLNEQDLASAIGTSRSLSEHMETLSQMGVDAGLDGVITSVRECATLRQLLPGALLVTPGIRPRGGEAQDQARIGDAKDALDAGANYMVIGRALAGQSDPEAALRDLGLEA